MELPKVLKLVYLEWDDADSISRWMTVDDVKIYIRSINPVRQVGFLLYEDERILMLAGQALHADDFGDEKYGNLMRIPKPWIHRRVVLGTVKADGTLKRSV